MLKKTICSHLYARMAVLANRTTVIPPAALLLSTARMTEGDDFIQMNGGRCGKSLPVRVEDVRYQRTIDCEACRGSANFATGASKQTSEVGQVKRVVGILALAAAV